MEGDAKETGRKDSCRRGEGRELKRLKGGGEIRINSSLYSTEGETQTVREEERSRDHVKRKRSLLLQGWVCRLISLKTQKTRRSTTKNEKRERNWCSSELRSQRSR